MTSVQNWALSLQNPRYLAANFAVLHSEPRTSLEIRSFVFLSNPTAKLESHRITFASDINAISTLRIPVLLLGLPSTPPAMVLLNSAVWGRNKAGECFATAVRIVTAFVAAWWLFVLGVRFSSEERGPFTFCTRFRRVGIDDWLTIQ